MQPFSRRTALQSAVAITAAGALSSLAVQARAAEGLANPRLPKHQFRAMWIATVVNIDWPSKPGLTAEAQRAELISATRPGCRPEPQCGGAAGPPPQPMPSGLRTSSRGRAT